MARTHVKHYQTMSSWHQSHYVHQTQRCIKKTCIKWNALIYFGLFKFGCTASQIDLTKYCLTCCIFIEKKNMLAFFVCQLYKIKVLIVHSCKYKSWRQPHVTFKYWWKKNLWQMHFYWSRQTETFIMCKSHMSALYIVLIQKKKICHIISDISIYWKNNART